MLASLPYVSEYQQKLVTIKLAFIVERARPEKVVCYGMRTDSRQCWSIFSSSQGGSTVTTLDLLIVTSEKDKLARQNISNFIDSLSTDEIRFIVVVHSAEAVNSGHNEGNPFFTTLWRRGVALYDSARIAFAIPNESKVSNWLRAGKRSRLAQSFYETACDSARNARYESAMFMLHQSAELNCANLLDRCLGYKSTTHNIKKLFALTENITPEIINLFPRSTVEENELFELLHRAYLDARYKDYHAVSPAKVLVLINRLKRLNALVAQLTSSRESEGIIDLPAFDSIVVDVTADIVLHKGEKETICIKTYPGAATIFNYAVKDHRLRLSIINNTGNPIPYAVIHITYLKLNGLVVDNSGTVTCIETIESQFFGLVQNGHGKIQLRVQSGTLDATLTKRGTLRLAGSADKIKILNTGSGDIDGADLEGFEGKVTIKGSGNVSIHLNDELDAVLEGKGVLLLTGHPRIKSLVMERNEQQLKGDAKDR